MASFSDPSASVHESLRCSICLDLLKSPKALQCMHTFCEECIQGNINAASARRRPNSIVCPECRQRTKPPRNHEPTEWAKQLPTNWPLKSFIERLTNRANTSNLVASDSYDVDDAASPSDLEECRKIEICPAHAQKSLKYYCKDHSAILCDECRDVAHVHNCSVVPIESVAGMDAEQIKRSLHEKIESISRKLDSTEAAMSRDIDRVDEIIEGFQSRLMILRNQVDLLMNEMQQELSNKEHRDQEKAKHIQTQKRTMMECTSLREALRFSKAELDVIEKHGTTVQRFIAMNRSRGLLPMFERAADDNATSARKVALRHEGIDILQSLLLMKNEMKSIQGVEIKLS